GERGERLALADDGSREDQPELGLEDAGITDARAIDQPANHRRERRVGRGEAQERDAPHRDGRVRQSRTSSAEFGGILRNSATGCPEVEPWARVIRTLADHWT